MRRLPLLIAVCVAFAAGAFASSHAGAVSALDYPLANSTFGGVWFTQQSDGRLQGIARQALRVETGPDDACIPAGTVTQRNITYNTLLDKYDGETRLWSTTTCEPTGWYPVALWPIVGNGIDGAAEKYVYQRCHSTQPGAIIPRGAVTGGSITCRTMSATFWCGGTIPMDTDPCDGDIRVAVMGDSYISGEGAASPAVPYRRGTDQASGPRKNLCHRTNTAWPVRASTPNIGLAIPVFDMVDLIESDAQQFPPNGNMVAFLACSGAVTSDITGSSPQYPGEQKTQIQQLALTNPRSLDAVFISIGGNDANFADIILDCLVMDPCSGSNTWTQQRVNHLATVRARVVSTLREVRKKVGPATEIYLTGYPDPLSPLPPRTCGSLGGSSLGINLAVHALPTGLITLIFARDSATINAAERRWLSRTFVPQLNSHLRTAADIAGVNFHDISDVFDGHPICGDKPFTHGLKGGSDVLKVLGNESFHPSPEGHDALAKHWWSHNFMQVGSRRNGTDNGINPVGSASQRLSVDVLTASKQSAKYLHTSSSVVGVVNGGIPRSKVWVVAYSLGTVVGKADLDEDGNADEIPLRISPNLAPGLHHLEIIDENGEILGVQPFVATTTEGCVGEPDIDGDGLNDHCDTDPEDGPTADVDRDGISNADDNCPLVANADQADSDEDGVGDACDPDQGADPIQTQLRDGLNVPPAAVPAPGSLTAEVLTDTSARITWQAPEDVGQPVTGYRLNVESSGRVMTLAAGARSVELDALALDGDGDRVFVRALSGSNEGAIAGVRVVKTPPPDDGGTPPGGDNPNDGWVPVVPPGGTVGPPPAAQPPPPVLPALPSAPGAAPASAPGPSGAPAAGVAPRPTKKAVALRKTWRGFPKRLNLNRAGRGTLRFRSKAGSRGKYQLRLNTRKRLVIRGSWRANRKGVVTIRIPRVNAPARALFRTKRTRLAKLTISSGRARKVVKIALRHTPAKPTRARTARR